jgi:rSAM/selenodomain-associated transferase 1
MVFLRAPRPGEVKRRLAASLDGEAAAAIYRVLVTRTLSAVTGENGVELWHTPDEAGDEVGYWARPGWRLRPQGEGDLGVRMQRAFESAFGEGAQRVVLVGTDTPGLTAEDVEEAYDRLLDHEVVVGPALDGGYWLIGMTSPRPELFADMPWSTGEVLRLTEERAAAGGLRVARLRELRDVDTLEDWRLWLRESAEDTVVGGA